MSDGAGLGIACLPDSVAELWFRSGKLMALLEAWNPPYPGLAIYYPGHRHVPAALRAFIDVVKSLPFTSSAAE